MHALLRFKRNLHLIKLLSKKDSRSRIPQFKRNKLNMLWKSIKQFQCEYRETRMESEMNYVDSLFLRCHKIRHCLFSQMNDCRSPIFVSIVYSRENGLKFYLIALEN